MLTKHGQELVVSDTLTFMDNLELMIKKGKLEEAIKHISVGRRALKAVKEHANLGDYDASKDREIVITGI